MSISSRFIVSCSYSEGQEDRYRRWWNRLEQSLIDVKNSSGWKCWTDGWPPGSPPHRETHYAFKYWAVKWAKEQGHRFVLWLDAGCQTLASTEPLWERVEKDGVVLLFGGDVLGEWISDQALEWFGVSRDAAMGMKLTGGCVVGLDFESPKAQAFFDEWGRLAATRLFVSAHSKYAPEKMRSLLVSDHNEDLVVADDPRVKGHRSDEACFALMAQKLGIPGIGLGEWSSWMRTY